MRWRRPAPDQRRRRGSVLLLLLVLVAPLAAAQQAPYTVQVVALSDRDAALDIVNDLLRQGYPAYVVRTASAEGDVFRVRVGAFANRQAALYYAEAMPQVAGGQPVPALAEAIPSGITPLAPRLLLSEELVGVDARLLLVGDELTLRTQQRTPLAIAEYAIFSGGEVERVRAWQLSEGAGGERLIVREMQLWPDTWREEETEVLEGYRISLVALVAERLELDEAAVEAAQYGAATGAPRLIVVERVSPSSPDGAELLGLGVPSSGMTPAGPLQYLGLDEETLAQLPGVPEGVRIDLAAGTVVGELARPEADGPPEGETVPDGEGAAAERSGEGSPDGAGGEAEEAATEQGGAGEEAATEPQGEEAGMEPGVIEGEGWSAVADGRFVRLVVSDGAPGAPPASWRAALGTPLWSGDGYLVAHFEKTLLIYDFVARD